MNTAFSTFSLSYFKSFKNLFYLTRNYFTLNDEIKSELVENTHKINNTVIILDKNIRPPSKRKKKILFTIFKL